MSFQWTVIAGYLYFEVAVVLIMILPIFSPKRWHQFFNSRLFSSFREHTAMYFYVFIGVLCLFLLDAIREMRKYAHSSDMSHVHLSNEMKGNVKLFRAQRNFYITGFSIFLTFVIRRLVTMLITQDELTVKAEKIIKQAESTVNLAKSTVLANTMNSEASKNFEEVKSKLEETESMLLLEKIRARDLETEATKWRLKFEEITAQFDGKGDK